MCVPVCKYHIILERQACCAKNIFKFYTRQIAHTKNQYPKRMQLTSRIAVNCSSFFYWLFAMQKSHNLIPFQSLGYADDYDHAATPRKDIIFRTAAGVEVVGGIGTTHTMRTHAAPLSHFVLCRNRHSSNPDATAPRPPLPSSNPLATIRVLRLLPAAVCISKSRPIGPTRA